MTFPFAIHVESMFTFTRGLLIFFDGKSSLMRMAIQLSGTVRESRMAHKNQWRTLDIVRETVCRTSDIETSPETMVGLSKKTCTSVGANTLPCTLELLD